jgi:hypothetical protein
MREFENITLILSELNLFFSNILKLIVGMIMTSRPSRKNESARSEEMTRRKCSGKEVIFEHSSIKK